MIKVAVLFFAGSLAVMYLTWRLGVQRQLLLRGLRPATARFAMIRDGFTLYQDARKTGFWPASLKLFLGAAFVAMISLIVPTGRLILSNQHFFLGKEIQSSEVFKPEP